MSPPAADPGPALLSPGTMLGKHSLLRRLAIGGMAEIYLARVSGIAGFEKLVVLKRILPQHAQHEDFIAMFLDEARIAATLHHPNIGQVYDIGQEGGSYYFTMEYIHGEDLRNVLRTAAKLKKPFGLHHGVMVVQSVAAGLHYAHEKVGPGGKPLDIVHRDVSPSNVIVTYDGQVKLVDFGIAKAASRQAESRAGIIKGKVSYMSPEQCQGKTLDRRCDVFALGILLYELTTGTRLFKGENELAVLNQIVWEDIPPPSKKKPGYPAALEKIVMRALEKQREDRYATAQELQLDLEKLAREQKLPISAVELARWMEGVFGKKEEPWNATGQLALDPGAVAAPPRATSAADAPTEDAARVEEAGPEEEAAPATPGSEPLHAPVVGPAGDSDSAVVAAEWAGRPQRKRPWTRALAAGVFVAAAVAVVLWLGRSPGNRSGSTTPAPTPASRPGVAPAPDAAPPPASASAPAPAPASSAAPAAAAEPPSEKPKAETRRRPTRTNPVAPPATTEPKPEPTEPPPPKPREWDPDSPLLPP